MRSLKYISIAVSALLLASCAKENRNNAAVDGQSRIKACFATDKSTLIDGGTKVYWEAGDELSVFFNDANLEYQSLNTKNSETAVFASVQTIIFGFNNGADGVTLYGLYPYDENAVCDDGCIATTLPGVQTGRAGSFGRGAAISMAKSSSTNMSFYNFNGGIRFTLQNEGIKSITIESNGGEAIAGAFTARFEGNVPVLESVSSPVTSITLNAPDGGSFETGKWYYITTLPVTLASGFKMSFTKAAATGVKTISSQIVFSRNTYGSVENIDKDVAFEGTGAKPGWVVSGNGTVAGLVDDNLATYWQVDGAAAPQSVVIDLGKQLSLNKLIFNNGGNVPGWNMGYTCASHITLEFSTNNVSWNTVLSTDTARHPYRQEFSFSDAQARYARLTVTAYGTPGNKLRISEIDLCGSSYASGDNGAAYPVLLNGESPAEGENFVLPDWGEGRFGSLKYWTHENTNGVSYDNGMPCIFALPYFNSTNGKVYQTFYLMPNLYSYSVGVGGYNPGSGQEETMEAYIVVSKGYGLTDIDVLGGTPSTDPNYVVSEKLPRSAAWVPVNLYFGVTEPGYYSIGRVYTTNATVSWESMSLNTYFGQPLDLD